jgi:adenine/guanine phosphoribosyltransferase-like PRPP-binding protein
MDNTTFPTEEELKARQRDWNTKNYGVTFRSVSYYLKDSFTNFDHIVSRFNEEVEVSYDTIIGTGLSGALLIPRLATELGCWWAIVRKENDGSHTDLRIEGHIGDEWLFVDDLIDTGSTLKRVKGIVESELEEAGVESQFMGSVTYNSSIRYYGPKEPTWLHL